MGHYDECREGYCPECGQTWGNCVHTNKDLKALQEKKIAAGNRYIITAAQLDLLCVYLERLRVEKNPGQSAELAQQILKEVEHQSSSDVCPKYCPQLDTQLKAIADSILSRKEDSTHPCSHGLRSSCEFCFIPCADRKAR